MSTTKRIAINSGGGYVPGLNAVVTGTVLAANRVGWDVVGIRDGYDGLLLRDDYSDGGLIKLELRTIGDLAASSASILGTGARSDPFGMRDITAENAVTEIDRSDGLLGILKSEGIDAIVSIVGGSAITGNHALNVAFKLQRNGSPDYPQRWAVRRRRELLDFRRHGVSRSLTRGTNQ